MSISPYISQLRKHAGSMRLLLPSVSVHVFDEKRRLLLVQQADGNVWSTPGGLIEPDERPADAALREAFEETGFVVRADSIGGVYGGPDCVVRYPNGDEVQYVIIAFVCSVIGGELKPDEDETIALRYFSKDEAAGLSLASWLRAHLDIVFSGALYHAPTWAPPETGG